MNARYNYNQQVSPPAPFVHATVSRPDNSSISATGLAAQVDIGADISVIPLNLVDGLQLVQLDRVAIESFGGHVTLVPTYLVRLTVHSFEPVIVRVLAERDEPFLLLGRDVLNRYRTLLDGPALVFEMTAK
jgi:hypothetical protein